MPEPTPAPDRTTPSDPQAAARAIMRTCFLNALFAGAEDAAMLEESTPSDLEVWSDSYAIELEQRLASAGLVIPAPDAAERVDQVTIPSDRLTLNDLKQIRWYLWMSYEKGSGEMSSKVGKVIDTIAAAGSDPA